MLKLSHILGVLALLAGAAACGSDAPSSSPDATTTPDAGGGPPDRDPGLNGRFGEADRPESCSSGYQWNGGLSESQQMQPGGNCIECHTMMNEGPRFKLAGTVMRSQHDEDRCAGVGGITIEITGADSQVTTLTSNPAGNFFTTQTIATPYTAKIIDAEGNEKSMQAAQTETNCASCHTEAGLNGAPGRIFIP